MKAPVMRFPFILALAIKLGQGIADQEKCALVKYLPVEDFGLRDGKNKGRLQVRGKVV